MSVKGILSLLVMSVLFCLPLNAGDILIKFKDGQVIRFSADLIESIGIDIPKEDSQIELPYRLIKSYNFSQADSISNWKTDWIWEKDNRIKGNLTWSSEYGGTARLKVSGAPCVIDFWTNLEIDLESGDEIIIHFYCKQPLEPISHVTLTIGPTIAYGHMQSIVISTAKSGEFIASMPIWSSPYTKGTPFGIQFAVWPGESIIYIKEINIIRKN